MPDSLRRAGAVLLALTLPLALAGCWELAADLAPPVARGMVSAGVGVMALGDKKIPAAGVIELRNAPSGDPQYRELIPEEGFTTVEWDPVVDEQTSPDGWRPAVNLREMNFAPPLKIPANGTMLLAYLQSTDAPDIEQTRTMFEHYFGAPSGTFTSDNKPFQYSLPKALPQVSEND